MHEVCSPTIELALECDSNIREVCFPTCNASIKQRVAAVLRAKLSTLSKERYWGGGGCGSDLRTPVFIKEE